MSRIGRVAGYTSLLPSHSFSLRSAPWSACRCGSYRRGTSVRNLLDPRSSCSCEAHSLKRHGIALAGSAHLTHPTSTPLGAAVTRGPSSLGSTQSLTSTKTGKLLNDAETHMITEVGMLSDWFGATDGLSWNHIESISLVNEPTPGIFNQPANYRVSGCASCTFCVTRTAPRSLFCNAP